MEMDDLAGDAMAGAAGGFGFELDQFLEFVGLFLSEAGYSLDADALDREIPVILQLLRSHLRGRLETPSSLIDRSGLSRGTGHRTLVSLVDRGLIRQRPRTRSGKTYSLHPSPKLIRQWVTFARRTRSAVDTCFPDAGKSPGFFFGATYLDSAVIPPSPALETRLSLPGGLRTLLHADPAFLAMQKLKKQLANQFGVEIEVRALSIDRLHQEILRNAADRQSRYDVVTADVCWMAELIEKRAVMPVAEVTPWTAPDLADFHEEALNTVRRGDVLYGLPVQTTPELLVYRTDLFAERGLSLPERMTELLDAARRLTDPLRGISGICWNGARGTPVGTTFMMLMADFGQPVINLPQVDGQFADASLAAEHYRPMLDTEAARCAAEFLLELLAYSPETVLQMSWFERARCYASGKAAMAYCYTQLAPLFELDPQSPAHGNTGYTLHPNAGRGPRLAPLGGWNLCIPANLRPERVDSAKRAVEALTSTAATKTYIEHGSMVSSRFGVCQDPRVAHGRRPIAIVDRLARAGRIKAWPRPAVAELPELVRILGDEIHTMLLRNKRPASALRDGQARCDRLMRQAGRY